MKKIISSLLLFSTLSLSGLVAAHHSNGILTSAYGEKVKTGYGECWTFGKGSSDAECYDISTTPVMEAKQTTAPPQVAAPTAAPAPMASTDEPVIKEVINLKGVTFKTGSDEINSSSFSRLNISAVDLQKNSELNVIVAGHTDNTGDTLRNLKLSQKRAEAVSAYLINKGIDSSRLTARGYGDTEPTTTNDSTEGRAKNRRVELRIH